MLSLSRLAQSGHWEHFHHGADIGVRGIGPTRSMAFEQAAIALTAVIAPPQCVEPQIAVEIACSANDDDILLLDWLNALIYEMSTRRMLFGKFDVRLIDGRIRATAWGEPVDRERHQPAVEIKAATLTQLSARRLPDKRWIAQCVVDV